MSKETGDAAEHGEDHSDCLERALKAELDPEEVCQEHQEGDELSVRGDHW